MNVLVLYQSRKGHTRETAEAITHVLRAQEHTVKLKSVIEAGKADIEQADMLFIGTWVQGFILFGVKPTGADLWVPALPALEGKPTAIFCTYAFNPRSSLQQLADRLAKQGAKVIAKQAFQRNHNTDGIIEFVETAIKSADEKVAVYA